MQETEICEWLESLKLRLMTVIYLLLNSVTTHGESELNCFIRFLFFNFTNFPNFKKSTDSKIEFIYCLGLPFGKNKIEIRRACKCNKNNATAIMSVIWGYLLHKISVVSSSLKYDVHRSARCWWKQLPEGGLFFIFIAYSIQFSYKNIIWLLLINF